MASVTATTARIAVLTASDRASSGVYEDKSGPAVVEMVPHQTVNVKRKIMARWWFHIFLFSALLGEDFQFDSYFSDWWFKTTDHANKKKYWSFPQRSFDMDDV